MCKRTRLVILSLVATALAGTAHATPVAPDDANIKGSLCLWLRNADLNYNPGSGVWADSSGRGNDARTAGLIPTWNIWYEAPTLAVGGNPAVFAGEFSAVKFSAGVDDLMRAGNINRGAGMSELTIVTVYKIYNVDESGAGYTRPVGVGSFIGEGVNLGNYFNLADDGSIRKDNGFVGGVTAAHPEDVFFIRVARMNPSSVDQWFNTDGTLEHVQAAGGSSFTTSVDNFYLGDLRSDSTDGQGTGGFSRADMEIAEVIVYNTDLSDEQIEGISEWLQVNIVPPRNPYAVKPEPADGALYTATWANLKWRPGEFAVSHYIYLGESFDDVNDGVAGTLRASQTLNFLVVGFPGYPYPQGLDAGKTYYWRVDEVNDADPSSPWKGQVWSFVVPPRTAYAPQPADDAGFVPLDATLQWAGGLGATGHTVYFGDNAEDVANAAGGLAQMETSYAPGALGPDKMYYWRVDEYDGASVHKGDLWSFRTVPVVPLHEDPNLVAWWTFDEGQGQIAVDWSGHGNDAVLFGPQWSVPGRLGDACLDFTGGGYAAIRNLSYDSTGYREVSVCAWIHTDRAYDQLLVSFDRSEYYRLEINGTGSGPGQIGWDIAGGQDVTDHSSIKRVDDGRWHHVCGVFDEGLLTIYIDGLPEPSLFVTASTTFGTGLTRFGFLGANSEAETFNGDKGGGGPISGLMDDVRIYNRALTQEQIIQVVRGDLLLAWNPHPTDGPLVEIDQATPLTWSAGDKASSHDLYFGTDRNALENVDTSDATGLYCGRLTNTTYDPPEGVEWGGGPYYWRVDENNSDGTVSRGRVWSFEVADFILVDNFEEYTDNDAEGEAIWQHWSDGYDDPTNGSQVGSEMPPYAEQTVVHGDSQSMPLFYKNADGATNSEAELTLSSPRDWTAHGVGVLSLWFRGYPASVGSFTEDFPGAYTMTGSGSDISGTADHFHFAYKTLTGVGSIVARVDSIQNTNEWAKAGVMIRETLEPGSKHAFAAISAENGVAFRSRSETDQGSSNTNETGITAPHWVKVERDAGGNFTVFHSDDGVSWQMVAGASSINIPMDSTVYVGLAVTSRNAALTCEAKFSNVTVTGATSPDWMNQDIGINSNEAESFYVAISDSAGVRGTVVHEDADAATMGTWTEWKIDLSEFADQGVNLLDVDKIAIGLGTRGDPTSPGSSGTLFIDDIRLYRPSPE